MRDGAIIAAGPPAEVITEATLERVFDLPCRVIEDHIYGTRWFSRSERAGPR